MEVKIISISGWSVMAVLINKITNNQLVFYAQNRLAVYNTDTKEALILADYVVIPEYDNALKIYSNEKEQHLELIIPQSRGSKESKAT